MHKRYLKLAIPFTISTITQPLLGAVDTAVIGRMGDPSYIGGVAVGAVIFNTIYWLFGFLRVSTSGYAAQSLGKKDEKSSFFALYRPAAIAVIVSLLLLILQTPTSNLALKLIGPEPVVQTQALIYFNILIWGAPFVLLNYVNLGWLMGRKHVKKSVFLQVFSNLLNIILDIIFVVQLRLGVAGVAYATLIAQFLAFVIGLYFISTNINLFEIIKYRTELFSKKAFKKIMGVNTDLMIRTVCLLIMTNMFVAKGAALGTKILAANSILFQIQYLIAYFFDGFANASSVYMGKAVGAANNKLVKKVIDISAKASFTVALVTALTAHLFRNEIINLFTVSENIIDLSLNYYNWLLLFPFVVGIGLVFYGIFTGATYTVPIRNSTIGSLFLFLVSYFLVTPYWGNHGLWLSFIVFSLGRSLFLIIYLKKFKKGEI